MKKYQNQHYVSEVLTKRFTTQGKKLQKYSVEHGTWRIASPKNTFSHAGYTQLIADGQIDNSLEEVLGTIETKFPITLAALDDAATRQVTQFSDEVYSNMAWYCASVYTLSPFFKDLATVNFLEDLNRQVSVGHGEMLDTYLKINQAEKQFYKTAIINGYRILFDSANYIQLMHRIQFNRNVHDFFKLFKHYTTWMVCKSPVNLPISDVALIPIPFAMVQMYYLPISPELLLIGGLPNDLTLSSQQANVKGTSMTIDVAENFVDLICLSAQVSLASKCVIPDIQTRRQRAREKGHKFHIIKMPASIISSGTKDFMGPLTFRLVTQDEYKKFLEQFV